MTSSQCKTLPRPNGPSEHVHPTSPDVIGKYTRYCTHVGVICVSCLCGTHSRRRSVHVFRRPIGSRTDLLSLISFLR
jgi:hypothetical protein